MVKRCFSWEDRALTFQLMLLLNLMSLVLGMVGYGLMYLPWMLIWEWLFRVLGLAILGPHMRWVGRHKRAEWAAFRLKSHQFEHEWSASQKRAELATWKAQCQEEIVPCTADRTCDTTPDASGARGGWS
jgi:hypothetical protein